MVSTPLFSACANLRIVSGIRTSGRAAVSAHAVLNPEPQAVRGTEHRTEIEPLQTVAIGKLFHESVRNSIRESFPDSFHE